MNSPSLDPRTLAYVRRHLQVGWWSLLCFLSLGAFLEVMHVLNVEWYLKAAYDTRRLMWTLGHVHGALLGLVHTIFAASLCALPSEIARWRWLSSPLLLAAGVLLPGGFFLGGVTFYAGDPGLGIFLVPLGALMLFAAVFLTALSVTAPLGQATGENDSGEGNATSDSSS